MNKSFLILDKSHFGDVALLIGFICSLISICCFIFGTVVAGGIFGMLFWASPLILIPGIAFALVGLSQKEQNKTKSQFALFLCILWLALWTMGFLIVFSSFVGIGLFLCLLWFALWIIVGFHLSPVN